MEIKPIKTEADYDAALQEIERLMETDIEPDTSVGDHLEVLVTLVEAYEAKHDPMTLPDPIEAIKNRMEDLELTRKDLEPLIGSRGRVSEILNRKRLLTITMIRKLHEVLHIPLEVLAQPYEIQESRQKNRIEV
jgi:HTH-type transcriptional regulator / antitoxin HigA